MMKKIFFLLAFICSFFAIKAETITGYVEKPSNWTTIEVHAWGTTIEGSTPWQLTETVTLNGKTWYKFTIKGTKVDGFLFKNASWDGGNQTVNVTTIANNKFYTIGASVNNGKRPVTILEPSVSFSVTPGSSVTVGTQVTMAPQYVAPGVECSIRYTINGVTPTATTGILVNGSKTLTINETTTINAGVVIDDKINPIATAKYTVNTKEPITVYFNNSNNWGSVYLYSWEEDGPTELTGEWPGTKLTETVSIGGLTWYKYTFNESITSVNVIFNGGWSQPQTADINGITSTKFYQGQVASDLTATYIKYLVTFPTVEVIAPTVSLVNSNGVYSLKYKIATTVPDAMVGLENQIAYYNVKINDSLYNNITPQADGSLSYECKIPSNLISSDVNISVQVAYKEETNGTVRFSALSKGTTFNAQTTLNPLFDATSKGDAYYKEGFDHIFTGISVNVKAPKIENLPITSLELWSDNEMGRYKTFTNFTISDTEDDFTLYNIMPGVTKFLLLLKYNNDTETLSLKKELEFEIYNNFPHVENILATDPIRNPKTNDYNVSLSWTPISPLPATYKIFTKIVGSDDDFVELGKTTTDTQMDSVVRKHIKLEEAQNQSINFEYKVVPVYMTTEARDYTFISKEEITDKILASKDLLIPISPDMATTPTTSQVFNLSTPTGVANITADSDIAVYPNPTMGHLNINSAKGINNISIFNLSGDKCVEVNGNNNAQVSINVETLPAGTYLLKIDNEVRKLIKK